LTISRSSASASGVNLPISDFGSVLSGYQLRLFAEVLV
jgi:hypothetical protein